MTCKICAISSHVIINEIEAILYRTKGLLDKRAFTQLAKQFPEQKDKIDAIDEQTCKVHFSFHQKMSRQRPSLPFTLSEGSTSLNSDNTSSESSLTKDIGKDEASILLELLNAQSATFTALTKQMNNALIDPEYDMSAMLIHPETIKLYNDLASSLRLTVREIRELNTSVNGEKDSALDGLKALALALRGPSSISPHEKSTDQSGTPNNDEMTTNEFD